MRVKSSPVLPALQRASAISEELSTVDGVLGVAVFGSVARSSSTSRSDADLLVLVDDDGPGRPELTAALPPDLRSGRLTLACYRRDELAEMMALETSFTEHLRREARVLADSDGELTALLTAPPRTKVPVHEELDGKLSQLDNYRDLDVFRGNYLFVLARLYALGKSIVMLGLYADGSPIFDRDRAFAEFRRRNADLAASIDAVESLRPFYLLVTRRGGEELPFSYRGCRGKVEGSISAIRRIAAAVA